MKMTSNGIRLLTGREQPETTHFSCVLSHLAVECVLVKETLTLVTARVSEYGVPVNPAFHKLALEDVAILIPVSEEQWGNREIKLGFRVARVTLALSRI